MIHDRDELLVQRALRGEAEAFGALYERHIRPIFRYVFSRVNHRYVAEDLTETIFLKAWRSLDSFCPERASFRTWLYRIARNTLIDHHRGRRIQVDLGYALEAKSPAPSPEESYLAMEERTRLSGAVGRLRPAHQEVLALRFISELSHRETARIMGRTEAAVRVLQHRALSALREELSLEKEQEHV